MSMLDDKSNMVPLIGSEILRETEKAYLVKFMEGGVSFQKWVPISKCHINNVGQVTVPQWMFDKLISE
jgi:hypothetical protein